MAVPFLSLEAACRSPECMKPDASLGIYHTKVLATLSYRSGAETDTKV
jgi:hypothetical protein